MTTDLARLNVQYNAAASAQKPRLEQDMLAAARTRGQLLLQFVETDAAEVLCLALPSQIRASHSLADSVDRSQSSVSRAIDVSVWCESHQPPTSDPPSRSISRVSASNENGFVRMAAMGSAAMTSGDSS